MGIPRFFFDGAPGNQQFYALFEGEVKLMVHHGESTLSTATFAHIPRFFSMGHRGINNSTLYFEGEVKLMVHHGESTLSTATFAHIPRFFRWGTRESTILRSFWKVRSN